MHDCGIVVSCAVLSSTQPADLKRDVDTHRFLPVVTILFCYRLQKMEVPAKPKSFSRLGKQCMTK